jgi:hypothetical protein
LLELPGVYERYVSSASTSQLITVLRYRCGQTGATVSLLPDFAQPYRLLASELIEDYFFERANRHLDSWFELLKSYRKGFEAWYEKLGALVGFSLGRAPPGLSSGAAEYFKWLVGACGKSLKKVTRTLTRRLKVSTFGRYQCHLNCHEKRRAGQEPLDKI